MLQHLIIEPCGGLCNRLRAIAAARRVCQRANARCTVLWDWGDYHRLIEAQPDVQWTAEAPELTAGQYIKLRHLRAGEGGNGTNRRVWITRESHILLRSQHVFNAFEEPHPIRAAELAPWLPIPAAAVRRAAAAFQSASFRTFTVGMHIRRTDHAQATLMAPDHLFLRAAEEQIEKGRTIFLATDNDETLRLMTSRFGRHILQYPKVTNLPKRWPRRRFDFEATLEDLIDLWLLASCRFVIGSAASSYSNVAMLYNGSPENQIMSIGRIAAPQRDGDGAVQLAPSSVRRLHRPLRAQCNGEVTGPPVTSVRTDPGTNVIGNADFYTVAGTVGHGELAVNRLGYSDAFPTMILARDDLAGWTAISAHAPSAVRLTLRRPAMVYGFLNCSAAILPQGQSVSFWADWNSIGDGSLPGDRTPAIYLDAGEHQLLARCAPGRNATRHAIWALRPTVAEIPPLHGPAQAANTAVVTIGAYPPERVPDELCALAYSAHKQGAWLNVFGVGERYKNHFSAKINRMRQWLAALPAQYNHVLYLDGRDTVLIQPLEHICREFNAIGSPIVVSAEGSCYPVRGPEWRERFPAHPTGRRWINAGIWMGRREALLAGLRQLDELYAGLLPSRPLPGHEDLLPYRRHITNDQFLWQAGYLKRIFRMHVDHEARLFGNVTCSDQRIPINRDFQFEDGKVIVRATGARPGVLHFSGPARLQWRDAWCGFLGAL